MIDLNFHLKQLFLKLLWLEGKAGGGSYCLHICVVYVLLQDLESCRLRLDPEMDRHRYERKISFAGVLDENEDSKDSLHSSSHTLKSEVGFEEKKGLSDNKAFVFSGLVKWRLILCFHLLRLCLKAGGHGVTWL